MPTTVLDPLAVAITAWHICVNAVNIDRKGQWRVQSRYPVLASFYQASLLYRKANARHLQIQLITHNADVVKDNDAEDRYIENLYHTTVASMASSDLRINAFREDVYGLWLRLNKVEQLRRLEGEAAQTRPKEDGGWREGYS